MKYRSLYLLSCLALVSTACEHGKGKGGDEVIAERFIHKYGYDVPKDEWKAKNYPGKVIVTHRNGVTVSTHYEDGLKHGECTRTYPHSQTIEVNEMYQRGTLVKRSNYDIRAIPTSETNYLSPSHTKTTFWYSNGTPRAIEEMVNGNLTFAEYYNNHNEVEARVENGTGTRSLRSNYGELKSREVYDNFALVQRETFHPNGTPAISEFYKDGLLHGPKQVFSEKGGPISSEQYSEGTLNGVAAYYQNGYKYLEIPYVNGEKEGIEKHYIDGDTLAEETEWHDNRKHGPSVVFYDGVPTTSWYYNNEKVSRTKYNELCEREDEIMMFNERGMQKRRF